MRVTLRLVLDCSPDVAWETIRSPAGMRAVAGPLLAFESLEPGGFPDRWPGGPHGVSTAFLGVVPAGEQVIDVSFSERDGARVMTDAGAPTSGPLTALTQWRHRMAVAPTGDGRTLYRDRLDIGRSPFALVAWPGIWLFWQWRGWRLQRLARALPLV